jgi:hypothetical protein
MHVVQESLGCLRKTGFPKESAGAPCGEGNARCPGVETDLKWCFCCHLVNRALKGAQRYGRKVLVTSHGVELCQEQADTRIAAVYRSFRQDVTWRRTRPRGRQDSPMALGPVQHRRFAQPLPDSRSGVDQPVIHMAPGVEGTAVGLSTLAASQPTYVSSSRVNPSRLLVI